MTCLHEYLNHHIFNIKICETNLDGNILSIKKERKKERKNERKKERKKEIHI